MAVNLNSFRSHGLTRWRLALVVTFLPVLGIIGVSWWLTAPLESHPTPTLRVATTPELVDKEDRPKVQSFPEWPKERLDGDAAKALLLDTLLVVQDRFKSVEGYTATFLKQERMRGKLNPEQTLTMKVREQPFAVYFKFVSPNAGKEVVYAEGFRDNKVIAHSGGLSRLLVPRLVVPPSHPLALADSRHPVTDAGLSNLIRRLVGFRHQDMKDPDATTILDRTTDRSGKPCLRSIHLHEHEVPERPFIRVEVLYDPDSRIPMSIRSYDWPKPGQTGPLELAESYTYQDLKINASLTALDFDPANPDYAFHRY